MGNPRIGASSGTSMRGRKPVPTVLKLLRGNPGKRPINRREPQPAALDVSVPVELVDAVARAEWTRTIAPAIQRRQITSADRLLALAHCECFAAWREQLALAAQHAHVVAVGPNKHPMPNPARSMANRTLLILIKIDSELGLSPASRSRVTISGSDPSADDAELDKILAID